jgi:hypothetical protein
MTPPRARITAHRLERLEPYEGKLSRTVLRGVQAGQPVCTYPINFFTGPLERTLKESENQKSKIDEKPLEFNFISLSYTFYEAH